MSDYQIPSKIPFWAHCFIATIILVISGFVFRHYEEVWAGTGTGPIKLPVSLSEFPIQLNNWEGKEQEINTTTDAYMRRNFADDYFSNRYIDRQRMIWADVYVVYCSSRPAGILGHRPGVCYPNNGWIHDSTETSQFQTSSGKTIPCLIHRMHKPMPNYVEIVVVNFYVVNGRIAIDENAFSSLMGRSPNIEGNPARYVSQIQISSTLENSALTAAADFTDTILKYLPDENGYVLAAPNYDPNDPNTL